MLKVLVGVASVAITVQCGVWLFDRYQASERERIAVAAAEHAAMERSQIESCRKFGEDYQQAVNFGPAAKDRIDSLRPTIEKCVVKFGPQSVAAQP